MKSTIKLENNTINRLYIHKKRTQTYDEMINQLVDLLEKTQNEQVIDKTTEEIKIQTRLIKIKQEEI